MRVKSRVPIDYPIHHTPFCRQEKQFLRMGVKISRTSMCTWAIQYKLRKPVNPYSTCLPMRQSSIIYDKFLSLLVLNVSAFEKEPGQQ